MVISVRAHASNSWVLPRIQLIATHYTSRPNIIIVDFGSPGSHRHELRSLCDAHGLTYLRVDDDGVYSAAMGRNRGAEVATTDLLFFGDVDCLAEADFFERLVRHANDLEMGRCFDRIALVPVYHLTADTTDRLMDCEPARRSRELARAMTNAVLGQRGQVAEYVDPFSNFLLCRRDFFSLLGGYNEHFRGHGSEDYEFLFRLASETRHVPLPSKPEQDRFSPVRNAFFAARKPYVGFRRMFEILALPSELAGLRIAHLHHDRSMLADPWYAQHDAHRRRFHQQLCPYLNDPRAAIAYDWLKRDASALVVMAATRAAFDLVMPLRLAGYQLTSVDPDSLIDGGLSDLCRGFDAVVVVTPELPDAERVWQATGQDADIVRFRIDATAETGRFCYRRFDAGTCCSERYGDFEAAGGGVGGWLLRRSPFGNAHVQRAALDHPFGTDSYGCGKLQLGLCNVDVERNDARSRPLARLGFWQRLGRRFSKLTRRPVRFMADSSLLPIRLVGQMLVALARRA